MKRWVALGFSLALLTVMSVTASRIYLADRWRHSNNPEDWQKAANLEPGNGEYWDHLGRYRQWDFDAANLDLAQEYDKRAVAADPRSSGYWTDLAGAYEQAGKIEPARQAFERAVADYPLSAEVKWNYGNFLVRQSELDSGFEQLRGAIELDPKLTTLAISRCWNADADIERILAKALPPQTDAYAIAIEFLAGEHQADAAMKVWDRLLELHRRFPLSASFDLVDELLRQSRTEEAKRVWKRAFDANHLPYDSPADGSVVWNGGFEHEIADGGLGWRIVTVPGVETQEDEGAFHSGARSMRIAFAGSLNMQFNHLFQYTVVRPSCTYHFRAWVRTQNLTTESGIRFLLSDPDHHSDVQMMTDDLTGTNAWTPIEGDLTTGPETHVVLLQALRLQSRLFENKIEGVAWVDDVSLVPAANCVGEARP